METRTYNVYKFDELSEESKQKAIEKNRDFYTDFNDWHEFVIDDWKTRLEAIGFNEPVIRFSGFWSQGDGASFTCKSIDLEKLLSAVAQCNNSHAVRTLELCMILAENDLMQAGIADLHSNYAHERTVRLVVEQLTYSSHIKWERLAEDIQAGLDDYRVTLCSMIYKDLKEEYYYSTSDETIAEGLIANDYDFTEDGEID